MVLLLCRKAYQKGLPPGKPFVFLYYLFAGDMLIRVNVFQCIQALFAAELKMTVFVC